jgi:AraC-like DNA-binding protein
MFKRKAQFNDSETEKIGHLRNSKPRFMRVMTTAASAQRIDLRDWGKIDSRRVPRVPGMERSQQVGYNPALAIPRAHRPARKRPRDDGSVDRGLAHHAGRPGERGSPGPPETTVAETSNGRERTRWLAFHMATMNEKTSDYATGHVGEVSRAYEELRTVSDVICHNLRAPLRQILGFTQLLHEKAYSDLDNSHRYHLDTVLESAKKLSALMDDLLKFGRLGRTEIPKKEVGLSTSVEKVLNQLHPEITGQPTIWQVERLAAALADLSKLLLGMSNLIATRLKFTRTRSSARIEIDTRTSDAVEPTILVRHNRVGRDAHNVRGDTQGQNGPGSQAASARPMISLAAATGLFEAIAARGGNPDQILRKFGIDRSAFSEPEGFIPSSVFAGVLEEAAEATADACFGLHLGEHYNPRNIGPVAYVVLNSPTVRAGIENIERYLHVYNEAAKWFFTSEGNRGYIRYLLTDLGIKSLRHSNEHEMTIAFNTLRMMVGSQWAPKEIQFAHEAPEQTSEHLRIFHAPVSFGCKTNAIVTDLHFVEREVLAADQRLYQILKRYLDHVLGKMPREDCLLASVRRATAETMRDGELRLVRVAKQMAMSARTLQRQLKERGVDFKHLADDTRQRFAMNYLKDRRNTLTEVAFLLGYSELSAFNRAFKRWTGSTPLDYRRSARTGVHAHQTSDRYHSL